MGPSRLFFVAWTLWAVSWIVAAFWSARAEKRVPLADVWPYRIAIGLGAFMMLDAVSVALHAPRLWFVGSTGAYTLAGGAICGFVFTWWARIKLGRLWSASITQKADHRVIDEGPYALVRHPIYTGLIAAIVCTSITEATVPSLFGCGLMILGFWWKARLEERFLAAEMGADRYGAYRRRVPMLVPFFPTAR